MVGLLRNAWQSGDQDLYWTSGDGGGQMDPDNNGQDISNLLAAVIRISVSPTESGYRIPGGNIAGESLNCLHSLLPNSRLLPSQSPPVTMRVMRVNCSLFAADLAALAFATPGGHIAGESELLALFAAELDFCLLNPGG